MNTNHGISSLYKRCKARTNNGICNKEVYVSESARCGRHYAKKSMIPGNSPYCNAKTRDGSPCHNKRKTSKTVRCEDHYRRQSNKRTRRPPSIRRQRSPPIIRRVEEEYDFGEPEINDRYHQGELFEEDVDRYQEEDATAPLMNSTRRNPFMYSPPMTRRNM